MIPRLRKAIPDDLPALMEIERASFADPRWDMQSFLKYTCTVAEVEGRIAGFFVWRKLVPAHNGNRPEREILNVAVDPRYRRLGIATALIKRALRSRATHFLEVRESNLAAQNLYRKLGFVEVARRPEYYTSPVETAIVMRVN